ncbi:MAG: hypothetical protein A7316_04170 [Candidatus Altiarchaeales archaeon WOR_SM1_86-2]|nr:MAG: hypothetical protein A7316_04170 [Candidatus Altiarchaeales archaeon WOR_SM1_86-2]ODS41458.1 MAG: hypothetical protein A7315_06110 [Candidatus Altiarchaeales archaeon WOR_SM1_79]
MNKEQFRRAAFVLGKDHCMEVVETLYIREWSTATEIAEELKIHTATAVKYLSELHEIGIVEKRVREGKYKDAFEYRLIEAEINLTLNFEEIIEEESEGVIEKARSIRVKERVRDDVNYEWDDEKQKILKINIVGAGLRRGVRESIELSDTEGRFLWNMPYPSEDYISVEQICEKSGIKNPVEMKKILDLVRILKEKNIIELTSP